MGICIAVEESSLYLIFPCHYYYLLFFRLDTANRHQGPFDYNFGRTDGKPYRSGGYLGMFLRLFLYVGMLKLTWTPYGTAATTGGTRMHRGPWEFCVHLSVRSVPRQFHICLRNGKVRLIPP